MFFDLVISPFAGKSKIVEVPTGRAPPSLPVGAATCAILLPVPLRLLDSPCAAIVLCLVQNMQLAVPEDASIREQGRQEVRTSPACPGGDVRVLRPRSCLYPVSLIS